MRAIHRWVSLSILGALSSVLTGCVIHDGNPNAEPIWWPAFLIHESTAPATIGYTSPGPTNEPVGGHSGPVQIGADTSAAPSATVAGYHGN